LSDEFFSKKLSDELIRNKDGYIIIILREKDINKVKLYQSSFKFEVYNKLII